MYRIYNRTRAYLFKLLDLKFDTETERMSYFSSFIAGHDFDSILDIGCGTGGLFDGMPSVNSRKLLVGIDLIRSTKKQHEHIVASAMSLPLIDDAFSMVTSYSLVEHVPEKDREAFYREARRVMKRHGTFVVQLPNRYFIIESHTYLPFFGFLPARLHSFAYRGEYVAVPSLKTVLRSLRVNGFTIRKVGRYEGRFLPFDRFFRRVGLFRMFPMGFVIYAQAQTGA